MRTQLAWEWRVRNGNKALSKCLKAPLFNVFAFNQAHTQSVRERANTTCVFVISYTRFRFSLNSHSSASLLLCLFLLSVSRFSTRPRTHIHTPSTRLCVWVISNIVKCIWVCVCLCFFYPILDSIYLDYCSFSLFLPIFPLAEHTNTHNHIA